MNMPKLRNVALLSALSVGGLGLVGVGAHATFTTSATASQQISAGTAQICLSTSVPNPNGGPCAPGQGDNQITLPATSNVGSSFQTGLVRVWVTNTGTLPINDLTTTATGSSSNALFSGLYVCEIDGNGAIIYNGPLSAATTPSATPAMTNIASYLTPGKYGYIDVQVYAGVVSSCGGSAAPSLNTAAQGESQTVTVTMVGTI